TNERSDEVATVLDALGRDIAGGRWRKDIMSLDEGLALRYPEVLRPYGETPASVRLLLKGQDCLVPNSDGFDVWDRVWRDGRRGQSVTLTKQIAAQLGQ
ncbi:MAG: hypothetical protein ACR2RB_15980, partial [Gammaproteobacteria bacterium]